MRQDRALELLARSYGIQAAFRDVRGEVQTASPTTLIRTLDELGVSEAEHRRPHEAVRARRQQRWRQVIEPVLVAWDGRLTVDVRVPQKHCDAAIACTIAPDDLLAEPGGNQRETCVPADLPTSREADIEGSGYVQKRWHWSSELPFGYHRLMLELAGDVHLARVISAPRVAWRSPPGENDRLWGVFVPLYALHSGSSWGAGDFTDLQKLVDWVDSRGGDLVATLPLLASQWDFSDDPSPYSPTSRLFWNEFYLDPAAIPEFAECSAAQAFVKSADARRAIRSLQESRFVDYTSQMGLKRRVLELLTQSAFEQHGGEPTELAEFRLSHPDVDTYAKYRAVAERLGRLWPDWPEPLRSGTITDHDHDPHAYRYHLFAQWQVHRQLESMARHVREREMVWYLDFPLGVNSHGYDVWRYRDLFATGASGGAPPDAFFTKGQNWGFPPLHPEQLRADGYRYFIRCLRHHLRYAKLLRIDHVMGLHRLYWIPHGLDARAGAYVNYNLDEFMAVLTLESHCHQAVIVGENLGTVPDVVNHAANRHGVGEMYVVQYEGRPEETPPLRPIPARSVASLNTHDMPSLTAFWTALDVDERVDLDLMTPSEATQEREARALLRRRLVSWLVEHDVLTEPTRDPLRIQAALLAHLGRSDAHVVFATLEDLWQEVEPQNTPGTFKERRNWQRKTRFPLEEWTRLPDVERLLSLLHRERHQWPSTDSPNPSNNTPRRSQETILP